jgi:hypothetical protein
MASVYTTLQTEADVLSSFAFADARHDFDRDRSGAFLAVLQESLPGHISWITDEDSTLEIATRLSDNTLTQVPTDDALGHLAVHPIHLLQLYAIHPFVYI